MFCERKMKQKKKREERPIELTCEFAFVSKKFPTHLKMRFGTIPKYLWPFCNFRFFFFSVVISIQTKIFTVNSCWRISWGLVGWLVVCFLFFIISTKICRNEHTVMKTFSYNHNLITFADLTRTHTLFFFFFLASNNLWCLSAIGRFHRWVITHGCLCCF